MSLTRMELVVFSTPEAAQDILASFASMLEENHANDNDREGRVGEVCVKGWRLPAHLGARWVDEGEIENTLDEWAEAQTQGPPFAIIVGYDEVQSSGNRDLVWISKIPDGFSYLGGFLEEVTPLASALPPDFTTRVLERMLDEPLAEIDQIKSALDALSLSKTTPQALTDRHRRF